MIPEATCVLCTVTARGWFVDIVTGDTYCRRHGRSRPSTKPYRSPGSVAGAIQRGGLA